jgi:hypothetical protein
VLPARSPWFGGLLIALAVGRPLGAQDRAALELGVSYVNFPQDTTSLFGPSVRWLGSTTRGNTVTSGSLSGVLAGGGASAYADASSRWLVPLRRASSLELGGELGALLSTGTTSSSGSATSALISGRLLRAMGAGGLWLRGSGNLAYREAGALWGRSIDAGAWWRGTGLQAVASLTREWTVAQLFAGPRRTGLVGVVPVRFVEGSAGVRVESEESSLELAGTVRRDPGADRLVEAGYGATATVWLSSSRAVLLNVTRQLPDFVHGAEALQSFSVGMRFNEPSPALARAARIRPVVLLGDADSLPDAAGSPRRMLRVRAPTARRVEVMGDFTGWEPVELAADGDAFAAAFALSAGSHRMVVRLDGGVWAPAANTPAVDDDFGGRVGLLLVP